VFPPFGSCTVDGKPFRGVIIGKPCAWRYILAMGSFVIRYPGLIALLFVFIFVIARREKRMERSPNWLGAHGSAFCVGKFVWLFHMKL